MEELRKNMKRFRCDSNSTARIPTEHSPLPSNLRQAQYCCTKSTKWIH